MEIQIRPARTEQAEELTRIALAAKRHWGYPERWLQIWEPQLTFVPAYFQENESWVAEVNDAPVAFYTLLERNGSAWLENLWVDPEWMGKRVGQRLFLHAAECSQQRGFKTLQLEADPNAAGFYEKMGMHQIGERHGEVDGQPRILPVMELKLES